MPAQIVTSDGMGLRVADLELWLDAGGSGIAMSVPACHGPFLTDGATGDGLTLRVRDGPLSGPEGWRSLFYDAETWQLWCDDAGRHVYLAPRHSPPRRQLAVDAVFRAGEVTGEFGVSVAAGQAVYPLQDMDMVLYANWLAGYGDLIVHASGIDDSGEGYCFIGPSGAGKSTLAACVASGSAATVLGEDQVILRIMDGRFLVYGTPWHTDPARCAPGGVPLKKVFFLDRSIGHRVEPCGRMEGIQRLLQDAFIPYYNRPGVEQILGTLEYLAQQVPFCTLGFQLGADLMGLIKDT